MVSKDNAWSTLSTDLVLEHAQKDEKPVEVVRSGIRPPSLHSEGNRPEAVVTLPLETSLDTNNAFLLRFEPGNTSRPWICTTASSNEIPSYPSRSSPEDGDRLDHKARSGCSKNPE